MNFEVGDIISYGYLWAHQASKGAESGRKDRPACLVVKTETSPAKYFLFPITSQIPNGNHYKKIPELECKRAGLNFPSYIILDQYNEDQSDMMFDLAAIAPLGSISPRYLGEIARDIKIVATKVRISAINRTAS